MKPYFFAILIILFFSNCQNHSSENGSESEYPEKKMAPSESKQPDSHEVQEIDTIRSSQAILDSTSDRISSQHKTKEVALEKPAERNLQKEIQEQGLQPINDTLFHYYINKRVSVKITPWETGRRWVILYDLYGSETYRIEEYKRSYTSFAKLHFASNGSVEKAEIRTNPGASRYWNETSIVFGTTNEPISRSSKQMPMESLEDAAGSWEYWNKINKRWEKQESMEGASPGKH